MAVIARWEWRTFGTDFGGSETLVLAHTRGIRRSDEIYLVSPRPDVNVKIRDGSLDVKCLQRTDANGLEQWAPTFKDRFPVDASVAAAVLALWHIRPIDLSGTEYGQAAFLALIAQTMPTVAAVEVSKQRHGGEIDGCLVEVADLKIDGRAQRTVAIEGDAPDRVLALVRTLGLDRFENVNYVRALQRILRSTRSPTAVITPRTAVRS